MRVEAGDDGSNGTSAPKDEILVRACVLLQMDVDCGVGPSGNARRRGKAAEYAGQPEAGASGVGESRSRVRKQRQNRCAAERRDLSSPGLSHDCFPPCFADYLMRFIPPVGSSKDTTPALLPLKSCASPL